MALFGDLGDRRELEKKAKAAGRLPPGQSLTLKWPVPQRPKVLFAFDHDGESLAAEHGGPLRLIVPHLYGWKSVKWVRGLLLLGQDRLGFWERNGYHAYGDPWREQRYSGS